MTFEAKYVGRCGVCDEKIQPGDPCAYSEDVIVHADCPGVPERPSRPICSRCFLEVAASGICGCDE